MDLTKRLAILGSTGSIGQQTLDIVRAFPDKFRVVGLAAGANISLLKEQIREFRPLFVYYHDRKTLTANDQLKFLSLEDIARHPEVDMVVMATAGKAGLSPTLAAVKAGKKIALANKESLVMAGEIITRETKENGAQILPVDSEHSAIWQCLNGETQKAARLILTASGGPFLHYPPAQLNEVTIAQTLKHPSWQMGKKVTIDSATLMNKGLEVIEAHWLFDMPFENIEVVIHRQSIVHSMVEFVDGSIKAQLSCPDMRLPIQYALSYPKRFLNPQLPRINWTEISELTFEPPDFNSFPCLRLAIEAGRKGGTHPAALCAADEVCVALFLSERIKFTDIARLIEQTMKQHQSVNHTTPDDIMKADTWATNKVLEITGDMLC